MVTPGWKRSGKGTGDDDVEPWEPADLVLPDDGTGEPDPYPEDVPVDDEWTEDDERRYQARREHERRVAMRRRRQTTAFAVIVVIVLGIGVGAAGYTLGWWSLPSSDSQADDTAQACPDATPTAALPNQVTVVVLNSTARPGLAGDVARELQSRGFTVRDIGNDDTGEVPEAAQVRHGPEGLLSARTVAAHVTGAVLVDDGRGGAVVDLSLGAGFAELTAPDAAAALTAPVAPEGSPDCTP